MKRADVTIAPTKGAPTAGIRRIVPEYECDFKKCEVTLNIGLFFDGTGNNRDRDRRKHADSNIARLHDVYLREKDMGYHPIYVPGVGTRFPEIGEHDESTMGSACAFGCEERVIFGLLAVFNSLHWRCFTSLMFDEGAMLALCRNGRNVTDADDRDRLARLGTGTGLLQAALSNDSDRRAFLTRQAQLLETKLKGKKPRVVECFLDVFGFSRGAAEARVFCHWLDELLVGGHLAGVPLRFRFVGLIDTVASAGFWSGTSAVLANSTGGHGAWASGGSLRVPASVQNCVHMVAMHELRRNFPLDEIGVDGKLQAGWIQHTYPGSHSDVGGGYRPSELGVSVGNNPQHGDSLKLSQIPLNHMFDCAVAAGAPMKRPMATPGVHDPFAVHPDLAKAYDAFLAQATLAPRPMYEWLQPYLNWRWQMRNHFHTTTQVKRASQSDREILLAFNKSLINDAAAMLRSAAMGLGQRTLAVVKDVFNTGARKDLVTTSALDPEAREVFARAQRATATPPSFAALFDAYVHDSLAGFNMPTLELTGYWRYRKIFLGNDEALIATNQDADTARSVA
jgi:hypothetical protein